MSKSKKSSSSKNKSSATSKTSSHLPPKSSKKLPNPSSSHNSPNPSTSSATSLPLKTPFKFLTSFFTKHNITPAKLFWFFLILILLLASLVRLYKLDQLPMGYNLDEAGMAYDAWSLANWRVDRNMMHLPVYLLNTGGGQSALYAYLTAGLISIFGFSKFIIRIPAVIFGLITIFFGSLITKEAFGKKASLLCALILTVSPYFIMASRVGLDCNLFLGASTLALYLTFVAVKKQKLLFWLLSGLAWGATLYTYVLSYIIVPIFLLLSTIYLLTIKKINWRQILVWALAVLALAWPLIILIIINYFDLPPVFSRFFYIPRLNLWRTGELTNVNFFKRLLELPKTLFLIPNQDQEAFVTSHGTLYLFTPVFIILGMVATTIAGIKSWCHKKFSFHTLSIFWLIGILAVGFSLDQIINYRLNGIFFILIYFLIFLIAYFINQLTKVWSKRASLISYTVIIVIYLLSFTSFCHSYFVKQPQAGFPSFHFGDTFTEPLTALNEWLSTNNYSLTDHQIYLDDKYIYFYLGQLTPPQEVALSEDQMREVTYQNYHFEWLPDNNHEALSFVPDQIINTDVFVIKNNHTDYIQKLLDHNFEPIFQNPRYTVYVNVAGFQV